VCFLVDCVDLSESSRCYAKILCKPSLSCFSLFKLLKTPAKFLSVTKLSHDFLGVYREEIILGKDMEKNFHKSLIERAPNFILRWRDNYGKV